MRAALTLMRRELTLMALHAPDAHESVPL